MLVVQLDEKNADDDDDDDDDAAAARTGAATATSTTTATYALRGLASEKEIDRRSEFCASAFSYKPNPPPAAYFARHYRNDPMRVAEHVRVAVVVPAATTATATTAATTTAAAADDDEDGNADDEVIAASCRVFTRFVSDGCGGRPIRAGGIGEVCTSPRHRRRGLSRQLLRDCVDIMMTPSSSDEEEQFVVSLLHAAPAFFPVYESAGYRRLAGNPTRWTALEFDAALLSKEVTRYATPTSKSVRLAAFPEDTSQLMAMHRQYSEQRFAGCIVRSEQYWNEYISKELEDALFVLTEEGKDVDRENEIRAWLSIRERGAGRFQVREFGLCPAYRREQAQQQRMGYEAFATLLSKAIDAYLQVNTAVAASGTRRVLAIPTVVLDELRTGWGRCGASNDTTSSCFLDWDSAASENDYGWMYKPLRNAADNTAVFYDASTASPPPHLIWPSDSF